MSSGTLPVFLTMTGRLSVSPFFQVSAVGVTLARGSDTRAPNVTATLFEPVGAAGTVWTVIVEVPNPNHPFGVRGVGEVGVVPPMAALSNAIYRALGVRLNQLPMSPGRVLEALWTKEPAQRNGGA